MSWIGWLLLVALIALAIVVLRGIAQLVSWVVEQFIVEPRELRRAEAKQQAGRAEHQRVLQEREASRRPSEREGRGRRIPPKTVAKARSSSRLGRLVKRLKMLVAPKSLEFWVASALSEDDVRTKIQYLSQALRLDSAYRPAWGMKGNALFGLGQYQEAAECFTRSLQLQPSASAWHAKGLCCHRSGQSHEALECFQNALAICPDEDRELSSDIARMIGLVQGELRERKGA